MRLIVIALLTTIFLAGCSSNPPRQIEISARPIDKPNLILPDATQLRLKDLEWIIITEANAEEVFAKLVKDKNDPVCVKSRTGSVITLSGVPVTWSSKLQTEIATSTMHAEYIALSTSMRELVPIRNALNDICESLGIKRDDETKNRKSF